MNPANLSIPLHAQYDVFDYKLTARYYKQPLIQLPSLWYPSCESRACLQPPKNIYSYTLLSQIFVLTKKNMYLTQYLQTLLSLILF